VYIENVLSGLFNITWPTVLTAFLINRILYLLWKKFSTYSDIFQLIQPEFVTLKYSSNSAITISNFYAILALFLASISNLIYNIF